MASTALLILITALGDTFGDTATGAAALILAAGVALALLVPSLAVSVRRLHDTNRSGWWLLLSFIPFGGLLLLVFWLQPTGPDNRYGPGMAPATSAGPRTAGSPPSGS